MSSVPPAPPAAGEALSVEALSVITVPARHSESSHSDQLGNVIIELVDVNDRRTAIRPDLATGLTRSWPTSWCEHDERAEPTWGDGVGARLPNRTRGAGQLDSRRRSP